MHKYSGLFFLMPMMVAGAVSVPAREAASEIQVGVASATVNPAVGVYLAGYDLKRKSTGVHDDLFAKAVVFYDGQEAVALVVIDSISMQYDTVQEIRAAAAKQVAKIPLPAERIIVQATHSHSAPDTIGIYGPDETHSGRNPEYMKQVVETAAKQVARAVEALKPAKLVFAETECKGWAVNDSEPGKEDNSVTILQCLDKEGKSIATLTNFFCHPTVLDGKNTLVSADWVGAFYKAMALLPGEHLFLQGAIGCWMQPQTPECTFALAEKDGNDLARKVLDALKKATPLDNTKIRFAHKLFQMPVTNPKFHAMGEMGLTPRKLTESTATEVAWFSIGPAQFATHPGETAPMYAAQTRALMKTGPKFILGLGLDHLGYICPVEYFGDSPAKFKEYLTSMSPGPDAGKTMMDAIKAIIP